MSRFTKLLKYFATEKGRQTAVYCVAGVGTTVFTLRWAPHTVLMDQYREFVTCYKYGIEKKLSDKVCIRFEKALKMIDDMDELERTRYKMFCVFGMDVFHAGTKHSKNGSIIGIPANYEYERIEHVPRSEIVIKNQPVQWSTNEGKMLLESLVLKENEQLFGMLREILYCRTWQVGFNCLIPTVAIIGAYALSNLINTKLKLLQRPFSLRCVMYALVGLFMYGNYSLATDALQLYYDMDVDKQLADYGEEMILGGIGFYDKIMKKNIAFRDISGDNSVYSASGNINWMLRQKTMPYTSRKEYLEKRLTELKQNATDAS